MKNRGLFRLWKFNDKKMLFLAIIILTFISSSFAIFVPRLIGYATDELVRASGIIHESQRLNYEKILFYIGMGTLLYVTSYIMTTVLNVLQSKFYPSIANKLREEIFLKIHSLPVGFFENYKKGDVISLFSNDLNKIDTFLTNAMLGTPQMIFTLIVSVSIMFSISWILTICLIIFIPIEIFVSKFVLKISKKYYKDNQSLVAKLNSTVEETLSSYDMVSSYMLQDGICNRFREENEQFNRTHIKSQFLGNIINPLYNIVSNISYIFIGVIGVILIANDAITIGDIQAYFIYLRSYNGLLINFSAMANTILSASAATNRIMDFLDNVDDIEVNNNEDIIFNNSIKFKNVNFSYTKEEKILHNISFNINKGEKVALVGPTGGGKSTVIKLLSRYFDITDGDILIDDSSIYNFTKKCLRDKISIVTQEPWLFKGTIMENIRYGRPDATDDEVIQASKLAQSHEFITKLEKGYDTEINEESDNVSQGQRQLITIARAIISDAEIVILDEATASVDTKTEKLIQDGMDRLMNGKTSIVIAHRLSTIFNSDKIIVINKGEVSEQGRHLELLENKGYYYEMYKSLESST